MPDAQRETRDVSPLDCARGRRARKSGGAESAAEACPNRPAEKRRVDWRARHRSQAVPGHFPMDHGWRRKRHDGREPIAANTLTFEHLEQHDAMDGDRGRVGFRRRAGVLDVQPRGLKPTLRGRTPYVRALVIARAAIVFGRRLPSDSLGLRLGEHVIGRLHVILPRPGQSFGQAMAAAMSPTLLRAAAAAGRIHAGKRLALILFDGCQRRRRRRQGK